MSVFFKVKSSKRSNPEERHTLDAIHNPQIQQYKDELEQLKKKITETTFPRRF